MDKAIFLDRDGTINEEMGYINHISRFKMFDFVPPAIRIFNEAGYKVLVTTNQSGLGRGYFDESLLKEIHNFLHKQVEMKKAKIDKIYYCPHHPTEAQGQYKVDCGCRKPKRGMIDLAQTEFNLNIPESYVIGDSYNDVKFGKNVGTKTILLLTGYGLGQYTYQKKNWELMPDMIFQDLLSAAQYITSQG